MSQFDLEKYTGNKNPFVAPTNFHEDFRKNLMNKISDDKKVIPLWQSRKLIAAILIAMLALTSYFMVQNAPLDDSSTGLEEYLAYQQQITHYDLVDLLSEEEIAELTTQIYDQNITLTDDYFDDFTILNDE